MAKRARASKEADRISSLPDELLCLIISFLPLKEAIRTSILSTRWRRIFTFMSNLNFVSSMKSRKSHSFSFMNFVDRVLFYHHGVVDKFKLICGEFVDSYRVDGWIRYALENAVRELDLILNCREFVLPLSVFTCKTLVTLRLDMYYKFKYVLKLPVKICLPNLKILYLCGIEISDDDSVQRLLSSASALEEVGMDRCTLKKQCKISISNPTLKSLALAYVGGFYDDYEILIDAPSLVYFKCYNLPKRFVLKNLNSLVQACVQFGTVFGSHHSLMARKAAATDLLNGISNIQSLHLSGIFAELFLEGSSIMPRFPKLTCLNLEGDFLVGWERVLPHLLPCFPSLQTLIFKVNLQLSRNINSIALPSKEFPSYLWTQLKRLEILSFGGKTHELHMVEYFLQNAEVLENFKVQIKATKRKKPAKWRSKITKTLLNLPKVSEKCKVLVV